MVIFLGVIVIRRRSEEPCMMNTLHKSLIIAILVNSIFISTFNVDLVGAQNIFLSQLLMLIWSARRILLRVRRNPGVLQINK
jgi:hypothetical protein